MVQFRDAHPANSNLKQLLRLLSQTTKMADFFIEPATLTEADLPEGGDPDSQNQVNNHSIVIYHY